MSAIKDFSLLTEDELKQYTTDIINKINSEGIFTSEVKLKVDDYYVFEDNGNLSVSVYHDGYVEVDREATWQCDNEDNLYETDNIEYE